jgi:hypothetical protein
VPYFTPLLEDMYRSTAQRLSTTRVYSRLLAREDKARFRYGSGTLVTGQPADILADSRTLRNMLLDGWC